MTTYQIVVRGELGDRFRLILEGATLTPRNGETVVRIDVVDQSHLHGLLDRIRAFGIELVSVRAVPD